MERIYHLPVRVKIEGENPDKAMRRIAEAMYNAVSAFTQTEEFDQLARFCDVEYSIYIKADKETFAHE